MHNPRYGTQLCRNNTLPGSSLAYVIEIACLKSRLLCEHEHRESVRGPTLSCQISGCSPEVAESLEHSYLSECDPEDTSESNCNKIRKALRLLSTEDEREGIEALSIIGPFGSGDEPLWGFEEHPDTLDAVLVEAEGHLGVFPGCRMGDAFDMGFCKPPGQDDILVSYGGYFFVQTMMLAILEGATQGRVTERRLWRLAMIKEHYKGHDDYVIPGVDYGPIYDYLDQCPWHLGDMDFKQLLRLGNMYSAEDIAEVLRRRGFWMWMRPDRFPINCVDTPLLNINTRGQDLTSSVLYEGIFKLPPEIIQSIALELNTWDIIALASTNKMLYYRILGNKEVRDSLARVCIHKHARWCLPYGEVELKWWNERKGDDALGWDYLRRCWSESHSMRNRRRIWRAAESIEAECDRVEATYEIKL
ncbi:unnamed protein product [Rhizoctonia solani]|uniref:F-box domain-containing protein n=1 Tax=Rhizoctonia solani TaxID=456999 RepID=A0A8H3I2T5_9AGAM|nr:unnamed protein product [Rhizoctonia solani]